MKEKEVREPEREVMEVRGAWCRPPVEWGGQARALVFFGPRDFRVVRGRTMLGMDRDIVARVELVHRCGTDACIFREGRVEPLERVLIEELHELIGFRGDLGERTGPLARLFLDGVPEGVPAEVVDYWRSLSEEKREQLRRALLLSWGRVLGHEFCARIVHVGSAVGKLTEGIGYLEGKPVPTDFHVGQRITVQTRVAHYRAPFGVRRDRADVAGVQLAGRDIANMAMTSDGAYAEYVRLTPAFIASGSVIPVPEEIDPVEAALVEPAACLLDCLQKGTHEVAQGPNGALHKKGVMPDGVTCVMGSGSMALLAGRFALSDPQQIEVGGARRAVFVVRSEDKADLVRKILGADRVEVVIIPKGAGADQIVQAVSEQYGPRHSARDGEPFRGFDDIVIAAPGKELLPAAAELVGVGGRIFAFAGFTGRVEMEGGVWHYRSAGVIGSSGCNTRMMEIVLEYLVQGRLQLRDLSGRKYRLSELAPDPAVFFEDRYMRPCLIPGE